MYNMQLQDEDDRGRMETKTLIQQLTKVSKEMIIERGQKIAPMQALGGKKREKMKWKNEFMSGIRGGIPIALGYLPVSFTFGLIAVSGGLPVWVAVLISLTNLTSAGQFAGMSLIFAGAGYMEIAMTTLVINLRYMLMSLSLSQKMDKCVTLLERMIVGFAVTDEIFVVGSLKPGTLRAPYLFGLMSLPILGWNAGTLLGACVSSVLPAALQNAFGIALYGMFIALIVPAARESFNVLVIILMAVGMNCILTYVPLFSFVSSGFRIIISTVFGAGLGAWLFPKEYPEDGISDEQKGSLKETEEQ